ncbi:MAG: hypothetical protein ABI668_04085 [Sphingorhabdus sp.]
MRIGLKSLAAIITISAVAACAPTPAPVPPPPPIVVPPPPPPPMPLPPGGASATMTIPPLGFDGIRVTPNRFLSSDEFIWHFRSAINVAALHCQGPVWGQIATEYNKFIVLHKKRLSKASKTIDREYIARYPGENGLRVRDTKMTDLYNYFALPPVKPEYCDAALRKVVEVNLVPSTTLHEYSNGALAEIDGIFIRFFDAYVQYERDLADWNLRYAPIPVPVQQPQVVTQPPVVTQPDVVTQPVLVPPPVTVTTPQPPG